MVYVDKTSCIILIGIMRKEYIKFMMSDKIKSKVISLFTDQVTFKMT